MQREEWLPAIREEGEEEKEEERGEQCLTGVKASDPWASISYPLPLFRPQQGTSHSLCPVCTLQGRRHHLGGFPMNLCSHYSRDMDDGLIRHCLWCHHPQPEDVEAMTVCLEYGLWHSGKMLPGHSAKSVTL